MASGAKKRRPNFSSEELLALVTGVSQRWKIISGSLSYSLTSAAKHRAWEAVVEEVNAVSGVSRNVEEVRSKFSDFKSLTKKKIGASRRECSGTGENIPSAVIEQTVESHGWAGLSSLRLRKLVPIYLLPFIIRGSTSICILYFTTKLVLRFLAKLECMLKSRV